MSKGRSVATEEIPQANKLATLRAVVQGVAAGALTTKKLETAAALSARHVRYYLLAAQTLGWLLLDSRRPTVTAAGEELLSHRAGGADETRVIAAAISSSRALRTAVGSFLDDETVDETVLAERLLASTALSSATANRRAECLLAWRKQLLGRGWTSQTMDSNAQEWPGEAPLSEITPEFLLELSNFKLSVRARNCLEQLDFERVGDLATSTESTLLHTRNCGRKTVRELEAVLSSVGLTLGVDAPGWRAADRVDLASRHSAALAKLRRALRRRLYAVNSSAGVEAEIASAIAGAVQASDRATVEQWLGLDQLTAPTLQQVGAAAGVTRERIRQIVMKARTKIHTANLAMPRLKAAISALESVKVQSEAVASELLRREHSARSAVSVRGLLRAVDLFGITTRLGRLEVDGQKFIGTRRGLALIKIVRRAGRRAVERWGCSTLEDVTAELGAQGATGSSLVLVRDVLSRQPDFRWLDEEGGWFWLEDVPRNRLLNKIDKMLAVSPRIELSTLRAGIARHYRMEGFSPPVRVLRALCDQLDDCDVVANRIVVDKRPRSATEELSDHELAMVKIFATHGPLLSHADVRRLCLDAGLNDTTTTIYLGNSPILRRIGVGVYSVIGATVSPGEVGAIAKAIRRSRPGSVMLDYGWNPKGPMVWATYKLSSGMLRNGVVSVPGGMKKYLTAESYELRGLDGAEIGRIGVGDGNMWGYKPFFRRRGGDVGDYMRVSFNLSEGIVQAELSDEPPEDDA